MEYMWERQQVCKAAKEISEAKMVPGTWGNVSIGSEKDINETGVEKEHFCKLSVIIK